MVNHIHLTTNNNWEPLELSKLKRKLANLNSKCNICEITKKQAKCTTKKDRRRTRKDSITCHIHGKYVSSLL